MKYREQIKYNWSYHWIIFLEIWDMFTLRNWHWLVLGLLVVLCVVPTVAVYITPSVGYYVSHPIPTFAPSLSQELAITVYYSKALPVPPILAVINYHWVRSSNFKPLAGVLSIMSAGLLLVAYLREK